MPEEGSNIRRRNNFKEKIKNNYKIFDTGDFIAKKNKEKYNFVSILEDFFSFAFRMI